MLGRDFPPREELINGLNKFTCQLHRDKESKTVDDCRYTLFSSGKCADDVLPPTCDSLLQHILTANFQTSSWCQCLNAEVIVPPPVGNGWTLTCGELTIVWMTRPCALQSLLECVECGCKSMRCSCKKADLKCTDLCSCSDCQQVVKTSYRMLRTNLRTSQIWNAVIMICESAAHTGLVHLRRE